ncbi:2'-5' RNA ligase [Gelidibacter sediminis]|uniref:2'-5' RNA ligase n=2 Tax=Gelidibacter sediminis TaxID=1608710 RepID=A0A4R7PYS6_9FLAO|nr:2'-5' RNA ligase [Gelidibacter sediminis]
MLLEERYRNMYKNAVKHIISNTYEVDPLIHSNKDQRYGLSLIIRPPESVKTAIQMFLKELYNTAPNQYYYPATDIHITVLSIISCYDGLDSDVLHFPDYIALVKKSLKRIAPISITCKGITASPSGIMIQGFPTEPALNSLRNQLRANFKNSNLQESMDQRYLIQTAHATVCRFSNLLEHNLKFLTILESYRDHYFGAFNVDKLELVYNDWYHRRNKSKTLHEFSL